MASWMPRIFTKTPIETPPPIQTRSPADASSSSESRQALNEPPVSASTKAVQPSSAATTATFEGVAAKLELMGRQLANESPQLARAAALLRSVHKDLEHADAEPSHIPADGAPALGRRIGAALDAVFEACPPYGHLVDGRKGGAAMYEALRAAAEPLVQKLGALPLVSADVAEVLEQPTTPDNRADHIDRLMTAVPLSIEKRIFRDLRLAYPGAAPQQGRAQAEAMIGRRIGEIWADGHLEGLHDEGPRPTERQAVAFDFLLDSYAQGKVAANTDRATLLLDRSGSDHFGPAVVRMAEVESDELAPKWADAVANRLFSLTHVLRRPNSTPLRIRVPHLENDRIRALTQVQSVQGINP
ncbi:MAG: hypothetical protein AAFN74_19720, partial [Myxococcota bacterium]